MGKGKIHLLAVVPGLVLLAASGCSKQATLPPTYPAHGKVILASGQPLDGGSVLFQSQDEATVSATSVIGTDGTFTLATFKAGARARGAIAGRHCVTDNTSLGQPQEGVGSLGGPARAVRHPAKRKRVDAESPARRSLTPSKNVPCVTTPLPIPRRA